MSVGFAKSHRELLDSRQLGHSMASELYGREDVFQNDIDVIFHKHWIMVGVAADVPEPGDVSAIDVGKASVLVVRDDDGEIRAFRKHASHMGTDFDHQCRSRNSVHLRNIGGLLFVCLADTPPGDIERLQEVMTPRLAPFHLEVAKVAFETDVIEQGNWKLVIENNRECYHCKGGHPELLVSLSSADLGFSVDDLTEHERLEVEDFEARTRRQVASWEEDGLIHSVHDEMDGDKPTMFRAQRQVIIGAGESQTMTTRVASRKLLGESARRDLGSTHLWTHSSWSHVMSDHAVITFCIPLSPDTTLVRTKWLVHAEAVEGVDYDLEELTEVWKATNAADARFVQVNHAGTQDPGYQPGPYSTYTEVFLEKFALWYTRRMAAHGI
ncbi:SRPBCC family protein [Caballeronia cordobensis]|uniref:SRPBCC family protein n=1 Tax=Caballeronia cordobensis TaxID=1353886 RepID=UPI00045F084C|nr:rieske 2Fe-2S domain-containing protein [Burkholderia sp. RPE67]